MSKMPTIVQMSPWFCMASPFGGLIDKDLLPVDELSQTALTRDFFERRDVTFSSIEHMPGR